MKAPPTQTPLSFLATTALVAFLGTLLYLARYINLSTGSILSSSHQIGLSRGAANLVGAIVILIYNQIFAEPQIVVHTSSDAIHVMPAPARNIFVVGGGPKTINLG